MPIAIFFLMLFVLWVYFAVQSGLLLWAATRMVRLKDFSVRRAVVWMLIMAFIQFAIFAVLLAVTTNTRQATVSLVALIVIVVTGVFVKRATQCGKRRAALAVVVWLVISVPLSLGQTLAMRWTLVDAFVQAGGAMEPVIEAADHFIVDRTLRPQRWDLIVFDAPPDPGTVWVSRLVGLPGETVEIIGGRVHINGNEIARPASVPDIVYEKNLTRSMTEVGVEGNPITLGDDEFFVLGDDTHNSYDSRLWPRVSGHQAGALPEASMVGTVRMIYAPLSRFRIFR